MAVPKKKTSPSRQGMRRSHHALEVKNVITDTHSGEYRLSHRMSLVDNTYKGKQIIKKNILKELQAKD